MIFNNKTVIITGGSEGVGAATARMFAEAGANLMLVARNKKNLDTIAEELRSKAKVEVFAMDVSDAAACGDLFKKTVFEFGRIDVLINNAGFHSRGLVEDIDISDLGKMIDVNLKAMLTIKKECDVNVGYSDHTLGTEVPIAACALGATIIEKHFTLDRNDGGVDSEFSMEPSEMSFLVTETKRAWQSLGEVKYGPTKSEESSLKYRRSLYISQDIRSGEVLSEKNLRVVRPGFGLHPRYFEELLGTKVLKDIKKGEALNWRHVK